jgi:hypothetical protein
MYRNKPNQRLNQRHGENERRTKAKAKAKAKAKSIATAKAIEIEIARVLRKNASLYYLYFCFVYPSCHLPLLSSTPPVLYSSCPPPPPFPLLYPSCPNSAVHVTNFCSSSWPGTDRGVM